jgi:hypothetical protein
MTPERLVFGQYALELPSDFDDSYPESKGYFIGAVIRGMGKTYAITFYDPVRLSQDIEGELSAAPYWFEKNVVVVPVINRQHLRTAVEKIIATGDVGRLLPEA